MRYILVTLGPQVSICWYHVAQAISPPLGYPANQKTYFSLWDGRMLLLSHQVTHTSYFVLVLRSTPYTINGHGRLRGESKKNYAPVTRQPPAFEHCLVVLHRGQRQLEIPNFFSSCRRRRLTRPPITCWVLRAKKYSYTTAVGRKKSELYTHAERI